VKKGSMRREQIPEGGRKVKLGKKKKRTRLGDQGMSLGLFSRHKEIKRTKREER